MGALLFFEIGLKVAFGLRSDLCLMDFFPLVYLSQSADL